MDKRQNSSFFLFPQLWHELIFFLVHHWIQGSSFTGPFALKTMSAKVLYPLLEFLLNRQDKARVSASNLLLKTSMDNSDPHVRMMSQ